MITVTCPECGSRWLYQPETAGEEQQAAVEEEHVEVPGEEGVKAPREEEARKTTITACENCSQQLSVPIDRGQLKVRCPKCGASWLFTP